MIISTVTKADLPALAELYQQLLPNEVSISKMEAVLNKQKDNPSHIVLVAKQGQQLLGSLLAVTCEMLFGQCQSFMVIEDVIVDKKHRRKSVGTALVQHIENHARKNNCSYIMLMADAERKNTQEFYKSLGYKTEEYCAFKKHL